MALLALHGGMSTEKWESILVILHLLDGDVPTLNGVALGAIRSHLAAVNIRVAIGAILADVSEHRLEVALNAFHLFVHAAQGIVGFVVVELGNGTDGAPTGGGVTVLARDRERAMGVSSCFFLGDGGREMSRANRTFRRRKAGRDGKEGPERELE